MSKLKEVFLHLIFGDRNIDFKKAIGAIVHSLKNSNLIKLDSPSILFFLGRWLPYSVAVGVAAGAVASFMDLIVVLINGYLSSDIILFFIYPLLVAIITGFAIKKVSETGGPGIGYSILHLLKGRQFISVKAMIYKLFVSILALSGGFVAGREGPSFFLGIGLGEWIGRIYGFGRKYKNMLGLIGGGAFTGALLKAPLGSSIFAMEIERMYDFDYRPFMPMIVASITSYLTFSFFRGNHAFIQLEHKANWDMSTIPYIIMMGLAIASIIYFYTIIFHFFVRVSKMVPSGRRPLIGTILGLPFIFGLYYLTQGTELLIEPAHTLQTATSTLPAIFTEGSNATLPATASMCVANSTSTIMSGQEILSAPANMHILSIMAQHSFTVWVDIAIIIFIILLTSFTLGFGIPGGLILPVLIIGTAVGNIFGHIFPDQLIMFTLAGMGAALSAAAKTPLAAIVMITEMSHDDVVIPMTAAVIASYIASFGYSLYLGQENVFKGSLRDFKSRNTDE